MHDYEEPDIDPEIVVLNEVFHSLRKLPNQDAITRVLKWVCNKLYVRASFDLPRKERLLRESREICGYTDHPDPETEFDDEWPDEAEVVADIETDEDTKPESDEEEKS